MNDPAVKAADDLHQLGYQKGFRDGALRILQAKSNDLGHNDAKFLLFMLRMQMNKTRKTLRTLKPKPGQTDEEFREFEAKMKNDLTFQKMLQAKLEFLRDATKPIHE